VSDWTLIGPPPPGLYRLRGARLWSAAELVIVCDPAGRRWVLPRGVWEAGRERH
jgi:hypothetical protein